VYLRSPKQCMTAGVLSGMEYHLRFRFRILICLIDDIKTWKYVGTEIDITHSSRPSPNQLSNVVPGRLKVSVPSLADETIGFSFF